VNPDDIKNAVQARMSIPDLDVRIYKNAMTMTSTISAELDSRLATQVAAHALDMLAAKSNMSTNGLAQMLQFLSEDHETQMRYTAWRTARRLRGDRV
jgi:uncharacterized protein YqiB (DUF1249 family)